MGSLRERMLEEEHKRALKQMRARHVPLDAELIQIAELALTEIPESEHKLDEANRLSLKAIIAYLKTRTESPTS